MAKRLRLGILGASGFAREVAAIATSVGFELVGFIEKPGAMNVHCEPVLGVDDDVDKIVETHALSHVHVAIGDVAFRRRVVRRLAPRLYAVIKHQSATVMSEAIGEGTTIYPGAVVMPGCSIGAHCLINSQATLGHDVSIGDYCNIGPTASIAGNVVIGAGSTIGIGATIREKIRIGAGVIVGAGAVVVADIPDHVVSFGNPSRVQP